ncbi:MAG: hypothetical protein DYG92_02405 [Leptolyngbya sp. PLA1]|nr:hypothetical protein [Leptolyngbya sp. PLA1]
MIEPTSETGRKAMTLANRLRVLYAELSDQTGDMRGEQLRDEVQRALSSLQPAAREPFLQELVRQFPLWSANDRDQVPVATRAAPAPAQVATEPKDPKSLAEKLIEVTKGLGEAEKQQIAARLSVAGLLARPTAAAAAPAPAGPSGTVSASGAADLRKQLGMPADAPIDAARAVELAAVLAEFVLKLEPYACMFWKDIAPDAKNQVYQTLNRDLGKFMAGDEKVNREAVAKGVFNLRSLVSLLLKGVSDAGKQFSRDHISRFSVDEISKAAGPGTLMTSKDVLCWKQYVRQMEGVDAASLEKRLKSVIAKDVDAGLSQVIK